jgi:hypothetical protein
MRQALTRILADSHNAPHTAQWNLKFLLGSNGLAWGSGDSVMPQRLRDVLVRRVLHTVIGLGTPLRRSDVQAEMIAVFEEATSLFFDKKARGQEINEVEFVWEV